MKLIKIDKQTGLFIEDVIVSEIPTIMYEDEEGNITCIPDPQYIQETPIGFYHPKWDSEKWVEGKKQEEIDEMLNVVVEPTELDLLHQENEDLRQTLLDLTEIVLGGM